MGMAFVLAEAVTYSEGVAHLSIKTFSLDNNKNIAQQKLISRGVR